MPFRILLIHIAVVSSVIALQLRAEDAKATPPPAEKKAAPEDPIRARLAEEIAKLEEMERNWQAERGNKTAKKDDEKKIEKKLEKAEKSKKSKNESTASRESGYSRESSPGNGGWVETGGVSSSSSSRSSSTGSYSSGDSSSRTSIGVRTTVVRLE